ncbi:LysR substrate-binding domain-containing protein [Massilia sp. CFBP9012]|uniref:LysR substrate-binding domain-containing protein n=1 Tax=Massilia sp. CFBP9012 TaxID=3096531 RepID=UPI002A69A04F|nr:LysR substrate-binding domain-containing protein [Massilia sp. CFBP9012]MDY0976646.1 LysR substrate-binding domain-containing protein [Massilia sp. CFBP9012]
MSDQLGGIAAFVQAAQSASFALAAEQLGLSRSAVGKAVARLEERLGVQLFHRTTRSLRLTDEGALFYERCSGALAEIRGAEQIFDSGRNEPAGRLRISVPVLLGRHCVAPLLVQLAQQYARLEIDAVFTDRPVDLLDDGFDLVVRTGGLANEAELKARRLGAQTMVLCAAPSYIRTRTAPSTLADLAAHDTLAYGKGDRIVPWLFTESGQLRTIRTRGRLRFDDLESIAAAAVGGAGLAWLPSWLIAGQLHAGLLVELLPTLRGPGFDVYAVWPLGRYLPMRVRLVIDELVKHMPSMLQADINVTMSQS